MVPKIFLDFENNWEKSQSLNLYVCNNLKKELNEINQILEGLQKTKHQHEVLVK